MASWTRGAKSRADSPSAGRSGSPNRTVTGRRPGARPALPARHGGERAAMRDGNHRHLVLDGQPCRAHPEAAEPAVGRAGPLRDRPPGSSHRRATCPGVAAIEPPRRSIGKVLNRHGGPDGPPPRVEEVVGRGRHGRRAPPLVRQREQDQRGVQVARHGWPRRSPGRSPGPARRGPRRAP